MLQRVKNKLDYVNKYINLLSIDIFDIYSHKKCVMFKIRVKIL